MTGQCLTADTGIRRRGRHRCARRRPAWPADRGALTGMADSERWYDPGQVKPRDLAINPRLLEGAHPRQVSVNGYGQSRG